VAPAIGAAWRRSSPQALATVVYSRRAIEHLERAFEFLKKHDPEAALRAALAIQSAVTMLTEHPLVGRAVDDDLRELVISFGKTGYVALYRFLPHLDEARVLAVRHQRELGYPL
jgi:plasmid stabilization system protein ParE